MRNFTILLFNLITISQAKDHPRILSGIALSAEQASSLGVLVSTWPTLSRGDKLLLEFGEKRILFDIVAYTRAFKNGRIDESANLNWMTFNTASVTTGSKKLVHQITTTKNGDVSISLAPEPEKIDGMTFSWHINTASDKIVFDIPAGIFYSLIRSETREQDASGNGG